MFFWSIILFLVAIIIIIVDIFFEVFGIIGAIGVVVLLASMFVTYHYVPNGEAIVIGKILLLIPIGFIVTYIFKKNQFQNKIFLNETLAEDDESIIERKEFLQEEGKTLTALRPYGLAEFNGRRIEVRSESNYILENQPIVAVYVKDNILFVREKGEE